MWDLGVTTATPLAFGARKSLNLVGPMNTIRKHLSDGTEVDGGGGLWRDNGGLGRSVVVCKGSVLKPRRYPVHHRPLEPLNVCIGRSDMDLFASDADGV